MNKLELNPDKTEVMVLPDPMTCWRDMEADGVQPPFITREPWDAPGSFAAPGFSSFGGASSW